MSEPSEGDLTAPAGAGDSPVGGPDAFLGRAHPDGNGARDRGWTATAGQGYILTRWVAAELAAARVEGFRLVAGGVAVLGVAIALLALVVDPDWPFLVVGAVLAVLALGAVVGLTIAAWTLRRLALPRRARHLRAELARSRALLRAAIAETGLPVSLTAAVRFVIDLARGRRPHGGVASRLAALTAQLGERTDLARLRAALAEAAPRSGHGRPDEPG